MTHAVPPTRPSRRGVRLIAMFVPAAVIAQLDVPALADRNEPPPVVTPYPIMFVTQVPIPADFTTIGSTFGNHIPQPNRCGRGGDLWLRSTDGALRNVTEEAGYGTSGFQGESSIAVREPCVHWSGTKALFSMVIGAPVQQYQWGTYHWQIYEVTGFGVGERLEIVRVADQPEGVNNVSPIYGSDGAIIFTSDLPVGGAMHLYPPLDEYESSRVVSGLWRLEPATGEISMLAHTPSGAFSPVIDALGRVVFSVWDHLQRDQQTDAFWMYGDGSGSFNLESEAPDAVSLGQNDEQFPEPRGSWINYVASQPDYDGPLRGYAPHLAGHTLERFQPWEMNQDGSGFEVLNHIGRHELASYFNRSFNNDPNLVEFSPGPAGNPNRLSNFFQPACDPNDAGVLYGIDAPTFGTHACGQLVRIVSDPSVNADDMTVEYLTHRETATPDDTPSPNHSGFYRTPLVLDDGQVIVAHTAETRADANEGDTAGPQSRYDLRLKAVAPAGEHWLPGAPLTAGIVKQISYYDPDVLVQYDGELWEMDPVEVRPRPAPTRNTNQLPLIERQVLLEEGISDDELRALLEANMLALVVSRNVTTRDHADRQQPFNLRVAGTETQTLGAGGTIYDVAHLQFFQGDQIRAYDGFAGRRTLAQPMHDPAALAVNPPATGPAGSARIAEDGSMAALVPARRAMSWQLVDPAGEAVVRERFWVSFQPGEMRSCVSCHRVNSTDQADFSPPENEPLALRELLSHLVQSGHLTQHAAADVNLDGAVDGADLALVLAAWGTCPRPNTALCPADVDHDGAVDGGDLAQVLAAWTVG